MSIQSDLADNIIPPTDDNGFVLTISSTARSYDLQPLLMGRDKAPDALMTNPDRVYLRVHAVSTNVYVQLKSTSAITLDSTYAQSEGTTGTAITISNKFGELVESGTFRDFEIKRGTHKFLHVQGAGAGTLRGRHSSDPFPGK